RSVSEKVGVVELQVDDVLEVRAVAVELAAALSVGGGGCAGAGLGDAAGRHGRECERNDQRARDLQAFTHALLLLGDRGNLRPLARKWESYASRTGDGPETRLQKGAARASRTPSARTSARAWAPRFRVPCR